MVELRQLASPPPLDLKEAIARGRWQEALFLTYSFDLPFFESYLLPILVGNGCRSIAVAGCARWLPERIQRWSETREIREAGRSYTLSQVPVGGVFHPKLVLAASADAGLVLVGSGNVSAYGMSTGGELFTHAAWFEGDVPSIAREAWQLCRELARRLPVERIFAERVDAMARLVPALTEPLSDRVLLHNLDEPILDQFVGAMADHAVRELVVWSPFTDSRLHALDALMARVRPERLLLAVQPGITKLDGARLAEVLARYGETTCQVRELRRVPHEERPGMIHAKGIIATIDSGEQITLTGSPNLSAPALMSVTSRGNFELAVLSRAADLRGMLLGDEGPVVLGEEVDLDRLAWEKDPTTTAHHEGDAAVRLLGARRQGKQLQLDILGVPRSGSELIIDGARRLEISRSDDRYIAALVDDDPPHTAELVWEDGRSGPVIVSDLTRLAAMRRGPESRPPTSLGALDYGADSDILALLEELAEVAIVSVHDVERLLRGRGAPTPAEEAAEADGSAPLVHLEDLDFERIRQHPRAHGYGTGRADDLDMPRIVVWLDEVVAQFDALQEQQLRVVATPLPTEEIEDEIPPAHEQVPRRRLAVSKRVATLVKNRLRRVVDGMADARLWSIIEADWMALNHALWLAVLHRVWIRATTSEPILLAQDLEPLSADLLAGFWGDDRRGGFITQLDEVTRANVATQLIDRQGDAFLAATAIRLLEAHGETARRAPYVVAGYVRAARPLGLVGGGAVERALILLGRTDQPVEPYVEQLLATVDRFSWDRFSDNLAWKHGLPSVAVMPKAPGIGAFASGDILVVGKAASLPVGSATMPVFAEWVREVRQRTPDRKVIQMAWGRDLILIYDSVAAEVLTTHVADGRLGGITSLGVGLAPQDIPSLVIEDRPHEKTA